MSGSGRSRLPSPRELWDYLRQGASEPAGRARINRWVVEASTAVGLSIALTMLGFRASVAIVYIVVTGVTAFADGYAQRRIASMPERKVVRP